MTVDQSSIADDDKPLTIALYSPGLPGGNVCNGIVTYVSIMRDALTALGHSVFVIAGDRMQFPNGDVREVPKVNRLIAPLRRWIEACQPEDGSDAWVRLRILDAFSAARSAGAEVFEIEEAYGWAGRLAGRGATIIERLHGPHVLGREPIESEAQKKVSDLREAAELASFRRVQAVTCPSARLLELVIEKYRLNLPLTRNIPNPIPVDLTASKWAVSRADLDQILCVGRFDLRKGADVVIHGFVKALDMRPSLKLVIAGPDTGLRREDGSCMRFDEFVKSEVPPAARERIRFLGPQSSQRIIELRLESAFAVVGSRFENFPYSIAEAMSVGMPVLTSDSFGNAEMVREGVDGLVVPVGDIGAMAQAMARLAASPARLEMMGSSGLARALQLLDPERVAKETVLLYREAMLRTSAIH